ncbi:D-Ala-D-Ala carboxypeptidase family metallohydrolase [Neisseria cinerea]|uniref:D-Ala-D-Ala carboxypeptidase family metallohydrolase n=1 Tax=Neisseria cinerea TaxID=483 RepID=UPI002B1D6C41|nr:D-Ala-D-Ala carboxypeptidase family metallohydrolase [Neisseria cinerea]
MQITEHFSFKELTRSETARRLGLQNVPSDAEMANIQYTAEQLEKIRAYVGRGIVVTSCFRSERVNKAVGGSPTSAHRFGLAADCDAIGLTSLAFAKEIIKMRDEGEIKFDQLILEFPERGDGAWVHIGFRRNNPMRNQIMTATKKNGKTVYLPGLHV